MSSSKSDQVSNTETADERIVASDQAVAVNAEGDVTINQVPDEALELGGEVVRVLADVVAQETDQDRSEAAQLAEGLIKIGIPAALIAFVLMGPGKRIFQ